MSDTKILQDIEAKYGRVTAENVVKELHDPNHPWHERLDWDDSAAGHSWRLTQARALIRAVRYERHVETKLITSVAYVRDPEASGDEQGYVSVVSLMTDQERARAAIIAEFARVASVLKRARELAIVLGMNDEIERLLSQVEAITFNLRTNPPSAGPEARQ